MNLKKYYLIVAIYISVYSLAYPSSIKILKNGEEKGNTANPILLEHDYTKSDKEAEENLKKLKKLMDEGKIEKRENLKPFLHINSSSEALAQTGIIVNFENQEDDKTLVLKNKDIKMKNGILAIEGNTWGYETSKKREVVIEDSKIFMERDRDIVAYREAQGDQMYTDYYKFIENGRKKQLEDIEKERILHKKSYFVGNIELRNSLLHLKNSELSAKLTEGSEYNKYINEQQTNYPSLMIIYGNHENPKTSDLNMYPIATGLHISRNGMKLVEGKYDLNLSHGFFIFGSGLGTNHFNKDTLTKWYNNRFDKEKGIALFKLGENTKMKAEHFRVDNSKVLTDLLSIRLPEVAGITFNPKEDEMIVFKKNSEATFDTMKLQGANVKFQGGKVNLITTSKNPNPLLMSHSQVMGNAVFNIKGGSILREAFLYGNLVDKNIFFTDLTFLPKSKIDIGYIKDSVRDLFTGNISVDKIKDEEVRGGLYKFTLEDDTKIYLGYSKRQLDEEIKERIEDLQEELARMESITPEQLEEIIKIYPKYKELLPRLIEQKKDEIKIKQVTNLTHASDADMHFKKGSNLYLFREDKKDDILLKDGEVSSENDEQGNLSEFTGHLTFDNSKIHLRSNLKDELSDQLISTNYPIIGEGATISLNNQGGSGFTGKEQIVLIKANKGTSSKTKFNISGGKITLGGYDYKLYERISENGKEYYLAHGIVEDVRPENVKPKKFNSEITDTSSFTSVNSLPAGDIKNKKLKSEVKTNDYALILNNAINIENSEIAGLGGKGIISKRAKLTLKKSGLFATQGLALDGVGKEELLSVDKDSSLVLENSTGGAALALKEASIKLDNSKKVNLKGSYSIYSNGGSITGSALFNIDGNIYHKGEGGINLTLEKGSVLNASILDVTGDVNSSKLHFKAGSEMYINNYSNMNMLFDKGSKLHLYLKEDADRKLDILYRGNRVVFTEPIHLDNTDIYFRTNMDKEESDRLEFLSTLTGTGANLHLNNHADIDMPLGGKEVDLVIAETPKDFKWNLANSVEIGGYFYNAKLKKKTNGLGKDIISITVGNANERKATLSSTSKAIISSSVSDYTAYNSIKDSIFDSLYLNVPTEKKNSVWAKISNDNFETKDYGMTNQLNTILVGVDRALDKEKTIYGGVFAGHYKNNKKIKESSGSGSLEGFAGGAYLSYRGYLGFGDFIAMYGKGESKYNVLDTASATVNNKQNSDYLGAGVRFGRQFFIGGEDNFYLESSAKITYGRIAPENSIASNKLSTKVDAIKSWTTGAYAKLGYKNQLSFGNINSYAKVGVTQEILGKYKVHLNKNGLEEIKLDGNVMNYGVGLEYTIGNNSFQVDFDIKNSPVLKNYYKVSVGYQYKF